MTTKNFNDYLKNKLDAAEVNDIEHAAKNEYDVLLSARANLADENAYLEALSRVKAGPVQSGDEVK